MPSGHRREPCPGHEEAKAVRAASRSTGSDPFSVAVVGAGISGLFAAGAIAERGLKVRVFEKSRGTGGRMTTRREGDLTFDLGAQYFTVRKARFERHVRSWVERRIVAPWDGRMVCLERGVPRPVAASVERFVGIPRMTAISRHLAGRLEIAFSTPVARIERERARWRLVAQTGDVLGLFDVAIVSTPPAQAAALLEGSPRFARVALATPCAPCWAGIVAFPEPLGLPFDAAFVAGSPLSWIARETSKPGRPATEAWTLHASSDWSRDHIEERSETLAPRLLEAFLEATKAPRIAPTCVAAHRWRFALADSRRNAEGLAAGCLWDPEQGIGACGDWCRGSRIEDAALSGLEVAGRVLGSPNPDTMEAIPGPGETETSQEEATP